MLSTAASGGNREGAWRLADMVADAAAALEELVDQVDVSSGGFAKLVLKGHEFRGASASERPATQPYTPR